MTFKEFCEKFEIDKILDSEYLDESITHSSVSKKRNYERLELLGDSVLNFVVSKALFKMFPSKNEGELAKLKGFLVSGKMCHKVANECGIPSVIKTHSTPINDHIISNVMESVIALIYLTYGLEKTIFIVSDLFIPKLGSFAEDPKMKLQEYCQKHFGKLPIYKLLEKTGTEHKPEFLIEVSILSKTETAKDSIKKEAEKIAAGKLLKLLQLDKH